MDSGVCVSVREGRMVGAGRVAWWRWKGGRRGRKRGEDGGEDGHDGREQERAKTRDGSPESR